jgi:hypothetical protein
MMLATLFLLPASRKMLLLILLSCLVELLVLGKGHTSRTLLPVNSLRLLRLPLSWIPLLLTVRVGLLAVLLLEEGLAILPC